MPTRIQPVILSGGAGTRLWPLSRENYPKQFIKLYGDHTLIQDTALRTSDEASFSAPMLVCNAKHRFLVAGQLEEVGIIPHSILLEPVARNTAAAIATAAQATAMLDPETLMLIMPSDHVITDTKAYSAAISKGAELARAGRLVTFGITPDRPETGYGYIRVGSALEGGLPGHQVDRFVEKPDEQTAAGYLREGNFLWNSGIFLARADVLLSEFAALAPEILNACQASLQAATTDLDFTRLNEAAFASSPNIAFDRAIMEKTSRAAVVSVSMGWSDVGTWDALAHITPQDEQGNALVGNAFSRNNQNCYIRSEGKFTAVMDMKDVVVINTDDAVLVAPRSRTQEIGKLVEQMKAAKHSEASESSIGYRPWGHYETLTLGGRFHVKRITVRPGGSLSLQKHLHRAEHWTVVEGTGQVTVGDKVALLTENQSVYVPLGQVHRLVNPGKLPLTLIEVQTGGYLGEDDIIRLEDVYAREKEPAKT